ncbi:ECF RNA polymerase sigma factor SigD [Planctomycetes bacterium Poly30]|uniref:ECF RNA polymerase sigma factor SigD n=1 Tax=Saltatorellus ferox TaxID=2528018 RepID=A0A518ERX4_9BACT|nr:ECF RNA polymerase sigma factor SigD [Planctomycetes bacterium Poly30]
MDDAEVEAVLSNAVRERSGAFEVVTPVLESYRARIERMVRLRMDHRVAGRLSVSDVMQDAYVEIVRRLPAYLDEPTTGSPEGRSRMPFFLWVRFLAGQALLQAHRKHLGTEARDAARDVPLGGPLHGGGAPEASSFMLAHALVESGISPSGVAIRQEEREALDEALANLSTEDREILFMRHFEQLSNKEIAAILGLTAGGASLRHLKALGRLQAALSRAGLTFEIGRLNGPDAP